MAHLFTCSHCQTRTMVDDRYSGRSGRCVSCGQPIRLPDFGNSEPRGGHAGGAGSGQPGDRPRGSAIGFSGRRLSIRWLSGHWVSVMVTLVVVGIVIGLGIAGVRVGGEATARVREGRIRAATVRNLEGVAAAMRAYAADHGHFPAPAIRDADGNPLLSWRVVLLPYLGEDALYRNFDLAAPWDAPQNLAAAESMPAIYRHPATPSRGGRFGVGGPEIAAYYVVTGVDTIFPPAGPLAEDQIRDGADQTLLLLEASPVGVASWTEPTDLETSRLRGPLNRGGDQSPGGLTEGGVAVATVDGRGRFLPESAGGRTFRALLTPAGGEAVAEDVFNRR